MNDEHRPSDFEYLEPPLDAAVKAALAEPIPEDAIERVKARARQLAATAVSPSRASNSRNRRWKASRAHHCGPDRRRSAIGPGDGGLLVAERLRRSSLCADDRKSEGRQFGSFHHGHAIR